MKYFKYMLVTFLLLTLGISSVNALSCSKTTNAILSKRASYIKATYEVEDNSYKKDLVLGSNKTTYKVPNYNFKISIYNISEDVYLEVSNNINSDRLTIYKKDTTDGTYTFNNGDFGTSYIYTIRVMSNKPECYGNDVKTITLTTPKYNAYSEYAYCKTSDNYYCQKFITKDLDVKSNSDFFKKIGLKEKLDAKEEASKFNSISTILKRDYKLYISVFIGIILVMILGIISIRLYIRLRKKRWEE